MAYTQADADALKAAMASGAQRVRYSDGSEVEYRSLAEMKEALSMIQAEASPPVKPVRAFRFAHRPGY